MKVSNSAPPRSLVFRGVDTYGDHTLRITDSNQGEPYRRTLSLSYESGAHGDYSRYEHYGSIELEGHEEAELLSFLMERAKSR